jgi:hypothetical protein
MSHSIEVAKGNGAAKESAKKRFFRRGPWENASTVVIGAGILMLMQPFALVLYTWAFAVIIVGTVGFLITSHFPE